MTLAFQALTLLVAAPLQAPAPASEVYGGQPVPPGEFPEVVELSGACTGVVVGPRLILTAAHCGVDWATIVVEGTRHAVQRCVAMHEHADARAAGQGRDFAACLLKRPTSVPPALLATPEAAGNVGVGEPVRLVGYGETEEGRAGEKRSASAHIFELDDHYFGAGGAGVDTCRGDSGGPAFIDHGSQRAVAGILSFGYACGDGGWYGHAAIADAWLRAEFGDDALPAHNEGARGCGVARPRRGDAVGFIAFPLLAAGRRRRSASSRP